MSDAIPSFYLYGEPHQAVDDGFVHVERLVDRSRPSGWTIRPHSHPDLHQFFAVESGGGTMLVENGRIDFAGPSVLLIPATAVHSFDWQRESSGWVLTVGRDFVNALTHRHAELASLFSRPRHMKLDARSTTDTNIQMRNLRREMSWAARGQEAAIEAAVLHLMVTCARLADAQASLSPGTSPSPAAALVARYRARIENRFQLREPLAEHAAALAVSESTLRAACARVAKRSPMAMLDDRALVEARRMLLYTDLSVAQVGYTLGFTDPAYFSRFFTRKTGAPPLRFRRHRTASNADPEAIVWGPTMRDARTGL